MSSTVTTRPTHYEVLGLEPTATRAEVAAAFTRGMSMLRPRAFGGLAELTVAHAVLSDPDKRRAYDREIGLAPEPEPEAKPALPLHTHGAGSASFARAAVPLAAPVERPAIALAPQPEPLPVQREPVRTRPIGEALAELARPEPLVARPAPAPVVTEPVEPIVAGHEDEDEGGDARAVPWKPVVIAGGGVVAAVALIGAWAGWQSRSGVPEKATVSALLTPPNTDFTVSDPAAAAALGSDAVPPAPDGAPRMAAPRRDARRHVSARAARAPQLAEIERQLAEPAPAEAAATPAALPAQADVADPVTATAASMPLSNATIARTIGRIGYPCGSVASTSQILGKAFTVTCTSGHSYRAAPVRGRYHFRKLASR